MRPDLIRRWWSTRSGFERALLTALVLGVLVRLALVLADDRALGSDGLTVHLGALRWADGLGYTAAGGQETAAVPPGWLTLLGLFSSLGLRSVLAHQLITMCVGLGVVAVAGLVGRSYLGDRVGGWVAVAAAVYPGFWLFEVQALAYAWSLLLTGFLLLALHRLWRRPTLPWGVLTGAICGLLALARPEQLLLLLVVVVPLALRAADLTPRQRGTLAFAACGTALLVIAPWTVHNQTRFEKPVVISTEAQLRLLAGNCSPSTYRGERIGYFDISCGYLVVGANLESDESEIADLARREAFSNLSDNLDMLPLTVLARFGRILAVFRPGQTVDWTAQSLDTGTASVWAWVAAFWLLLPAAALGAVRARRSGALFLPLLAPVAVVMVVALVTYGDPTHRAPADLGILVLGAAGLEWLWSRRSGLSQVRLLPARRAGGLPELSEVAEGLPELPAPEVVPELPAPVVSPEPEPAEVTEAPAGEEAEAPAEEPVTGKKQKKAKKPKKPKRLPHVVVPRRPSG